MRWASVNNSLTGGFWVFYGSEISNTRKSSARFFSHHGEAVEYARDWLRGN